METGVHGPRGPFVRVEVLARTIQTRAERDNGPRRPRGIFIGIDVPPRPRAHEVMARRPRGTFIGVDVSPTSRPHEVMAMRPRGTVSHVDIPPLSEVQGEPVVNRRRSTRR